MTFEGDNQADRLPFGQRRVGDLLQPTRCVRRNMLTYFFDRVSMVRDRLLLSPTFNRWAFAVPGARQIAQRETRALFDLCAGFVYSQVLLACVRIGLFDRLRSGPQTLGVLAHQTGLPDASLRRLLQAACSLRLVELRSGDRYGLGVLGAAVAASPGIGAMVEHHATLYADLFDPVALLRSEKPQTQMAAYWPYATGVAAGGLQDGDVSTYTALMATSQVMIAEQVLDAYDFNRHMRLLDVGGGDGTFLRAVALRAPRLELVLFDLPAVAALAAERFAESELTSRARAHGGDFYADSLPPGADVVTLVRVLFDHDDERAVRILKAVHAALPPNGTLLIAEPMAGEAASDPVADAYFNFYLLAMGRGRSRSPNDFSRLLDVAGFAAPTRLTTRNPLLAQVLSARPKK
jgi:demethylspheroidene O-methyltransferase